MPAVDELRRLLYPHGTFRARVLVAMVRYRWFIRLRWIMAFAALALLVVERLVTPEFHRPHAVMICIGVLAVVNVLWTFLSRGLRDELADNCTEGSSALRLVVLFCNAQMTVDLLVLTAILRYSGGVENPMSIFYLFHMLIAAMLLRPFNALVQGCWALLLYGALGFGECLGWITPHYPFLPSTATAAVHWNWVHVLSGVGVLGAGIFGTLYFTLQISSRLDEQESELYETNKALQRSRDAVEHLQERRSRFMQTAAHQLKSPLTGIEMLAGLIRDNVASAEKIRETVERIIRRCREAIVQVSELLTLERVEQVSPARHRSARTDVAEVVERVTARYTEQARSKGLSLHMDTSGCRGERAAVDARGLDDCVTNLVDNAIKFTPPKGDIWVTTACDENTISVCVKDTGMGIAEENKDEIFEPFRRGNQALAANIPGTGLGLAIVRGVVEQAEGRIEVRSTLGEGSEFVLFFPRGKPYCDALASGSGPATEQTAPASLGVQVCGEEKH
jgi:signal transduction histidine kinase